MCYYITATVPRGTNIGALAPLLTECKLGFEPLENRSIAEKIGADKVYFKPTLSDCDCGTPLGGMNVRQSYDLKALEKQAAAYRRKGWSENKVKRWLEEKRATENRYEAKTQAERTDWMLTDSEWLFNIQKILLSGLVKEFGLLLHWYTGPLNGRIELTGIRKQKIVDADSMYFHAYPEDVLTYFT